MGSGSRSQPESIFARARVWSGNRTCLIQTDPSRFRDRPQLRPDNCRSLPPFSRRPLAPADSRCLPATDIRQLAYPLAPPPFAKCWNTRFNHKVPLKVLNLHDLSIKILGRKELRLDPSSRSPVKPSRRGSGPAVYLKNRPMKSDKAFQKLPFRFSPVEARAFRPARVAAPRKPLYSLLKNALGTGFEGAQLQLRRCKPFKFVFPRRLQPPRDPRFPVFQQTV